jgi:hypothetical protein
MAMLNNQMVYPVILSVFEESIPVMIHGVYHVNPRSIQDLQVDLIRELPPK